MAISTITVLVMLSTSLLTDNGFAYAADAPVVQTLYGKVQGTQLYLQDNDKPALAYLGVPFAAPPIGSKRFLPPDDPMSWDGIRNATKIGPSCPQDDTAAELVREMFNLEGYMMQTSEDCLHLNVYTPDVTAKNPVMVFIHGGGLVIGGSELYDSRVYAILKDVVVVIIHYRLGPLGFLSTGDDVIPGNMGLLDQLAALKWVQQNIINFGGDPNQVTIFGESAGSWSVSMHLLSPMSQGLFKRAIMQSGSIPGSLFFKSREDTLTNTKTFAEFVGCPAGDNLAMLDCLRELPHEHLTNPPKGNPALLGVMWVPTVDGSFMPKDATVLQNQGGLKKDMDLIAGVCRMEGFMLGQGVYPPFTQDNFTADVLRFVIKGQVQFYYPQLSEAQSLEITQAAMDMYKVDNTQKSFVDFVGDFMISVPTYRTALAASETTRGNVFFYEFDYRPSLSVKPEWVIGDHGDDILPTFGYTYLVPNQDENPFSEGDVKVEQLMLDYWSNFAKTGNPNGENLPEWKSFQDGESYIRLKPSPEAATKYNPDRYKFWTQTIPRILWYTRHDSAAEATSSEPVALLVLCMIGIWHIVVT